MSGATQESIEQGLGKTLDVQRVRSDFPILRETAHGRPLVYLDSAASTQKPRRVIDAICAFYERDNANVHRATHELARRSTEAFEAARAQIASYIGALDPSSVVFTAGDTDALNLVAASYGGATLAPGDRVLLTAMEHHSNIVPWQMVCASAGAEIIVAPLAADGAIDLQAFDELLDERVRIVSLPWVSNVLGTVNPIERVAASAKEVGAALVVDGAQAIPHVRIDVEQAGLDFLTLASHKAFGPTGVGALYARPELLERMAPLRGGGEMVEEVSFEKSRYAEPPARFEAGTPNIAGAVGFAEALRYVESLGLDACLAHERGLVEHGERVLSGVEGLTLHGRARPRAPIFSFSIDGCHPYDMALMLDRMGVAVRSGHHCAQPLTESLGQASTLRASCTIYNTTEELDALGEALVRAREMLQ